MESYAYDYDSAKVLQNFVVGVYLGEYSLISGLELCTDQRRRLYSATGTDRLQTSLEGYLRVAGNVEPFHAGDALGPLSSSMRCCHDIRSCGISEIFGNQKVV